MRIQRTLQVFLSGWALATSGALMAATPPAIPVLVDSVKDKAVALLERNLALLRDHRTGGVQYTATFAEGAKVHCDVCLPPGPVDFEAYYFQVTAVFPNGMDFTHTVHRDRIEMERVDVKYYVRVPFTKDMPEVGPKGVVPGKRQRVHLVAVVVYDFSNEQLKIREIVLDKPPGENAWMVELSPLMALGEPSPGELEDLGPEWGGSAFQAGVMRYLYPGKGTNRHNLWLKVGLRAGIRQVNLRSDGADYTTQGIALLPTRSLLTSLSAVQHRLDLSQSVTDITEKVTSITLELPIGLSKRWALSRRVDLGLELEMGVGLELSRNVNGDYTMEQLGRQTFTWGDANVDQVTSAGADLTYDSSPQSVTAASGTVYEFFRDDVMVLDDLESKAKPYFFWGINPSLFLRGLNDQVKYQVGLRLAMVGANRNTGTVDGDYFMDQDDTTRPALTTLAEGRFQPFVGILLGIKL